MKLLLISGRSGSGKSTVLQVLEDLEYYCIDNLPLNMLTMFLDQLEKTQTHIAIGIDSRNIGEKHKDSFKIIKNVKQQLNCEVVYLDADDRHLMRRFKETRRKHPLSNQDIDLKQAFEADKQLLSPISALADWIIDTSHLSPHQLRTRIIEHINHEQKQTLSIFVTSFGFKNGSPTDADFMFDARCLPNPYWHKALRKQTGLDEAVLTFMQDHPECGAMLNDIQQFFSNWLPAFKAENRKYLTIALGCTGGQHRSVYLAEQLGHYLRTMDNKVTIKHRDLAQ